MIAHRLGEPYGTLVLTFAVTIIEVSVIVAMMLHGDNNPTLARESVFSTVMIICGGVVGFCLTFGGLRHRHQELKRQGTNAYLAVLTALAVLTLVLPNYTLAVGHGSFLAGAARLRQRALGSALRQLRLRPDGSAQGGFRRGADRAQGQGSTSLGRGRHLRQCAASLRRPGRRRASCGGYRRRRRGRAGQALQVKQADAIVGAFIATLALMPESLAAFRASLNNELQRSLNIALGSTCATIGLTIPAVAAASLITGKELTLGLEFGRHGASCCSSSRVSMISFGTGRTTFLTGLVHLVVFCAYVFLIFFP